MANHSSILPWEYMNRGVWWATVHGVTRVGHDLAVTSPFSSVQFSHVRLWDPIKCRTPGFPVHQLLKLTQTHVHRVSDASNHLILCHPLSSHLQPFLASESFPVSQFFASGGQSIGVSGFSISPSSEYSGLISFRTYWFDLLAVQGTLQSLFHYHSSKASILQRLAFFIVQLSHPYTTTGKTIALTR